MLLGRWEMRQGWRGWTWSWFPGPLVLTDTKEVALVLLPGLFHL